ncbi:MAG: hypothetical protein AAF587_22995 [Bacteroidota bacterium]
MNKKNNPFREMMPEEEAPKPELKADLMRSLNLKRFIYQTVEMFTAILGVAAREALPIRNEEEDASE